jgi:methyl-accepting chemotaxis protein
MINLGVKRGLVALSAITIVGLLLATGGGLWLAHNAADVAKNIYATRTAPSGQLMQAVDALHRARETILLAVSEESEEVAQAHLDRMAALDKTLANTLQAYVQAVPDQKMAIDGLGELITQYNKARDQSVMMISVGDQPSALENIKSNAGPKFDKVLDELSKVIESQSTLARDDYEAAKARIDSQSSIQWALAFLMLAGLGWAFVVIGRAITGPLNQLKQVMVASQQDLNLTLRAKVVRQDEIGQTAQAFNTLMDSFQEMLSAVHGSTLSLANMSGNLSDAAQKVARASENQSASSSAIAASVEEMSVSVSSVSEHALAATQQSEQARTLASQGSDLVAKLLDKIEHVSNAVRLSAEGIDSLGARSKEIENITQVIGDMADQTNLLALNAAIEAARAGESGRGFAVVADEVRRLAERSAQAAKEISSMISGILASTTLVVNQMKQEVRDVDEEASLSHGTGRAIAGISQAASNTARAITEVSTAIREQGAASQEVARHIESIAQMTEQNSVSVQQTALAASSVGAEAVRLQQMVNRFRIA